MELIVLEFLVAYKNQWNLESNKYFTGELAAD